MADLVQERLEEMLPELRDLEHLGLFTAAELQQIQRSRSKFEYAITGRAATISDFQEYVKHELAVEQLRRARKERLIVKQHSISSFSIVRRIHKIYQRGLTRFPHEKSLFIEYIKFAAQSGAASAFNRILMRAIRHHPREAIFWQVAAERQLKLGHVDAARALIFRGLRTKVYDVVTLWLAMVNIEASVVRKFPEHQAALVVVIEQANNALAQTQDFQVDFLTQVFKQVSGLELADAKEAARKCLLKIKDQAFVSSLEKSDDDNLFIEDY